MSTPTSDWDVIVVGAGPAGASAALALGGSGLRVAIVEKAHPPRYKTCGGGVLRRAMALLPAEVGLAVERECHVAELAHHDPAFRFTCERREPIVSMVMRDRFDYLIASAAVKAGAQLMPDTTVIDVSAVDNAVKLVTSRGELRSRFLIAADGVSGVVARKTGRPELHDIFPALEYEVTLAPQDMAPWLAAARFDFGVIAAGYGWVFPKREHLSIGVGTTRRGAANLPQAYRVYTERLGLGRPLHEERHGYMIPCRPREGLFDVPRVMFVGDAAGLADPITAEGITAGIVSGQLAARAILDGRLVPTDVNARYRATLEERWLSELRIARWLAWVLYDCPRLRVALFRRHGQRMSELMTRIVTGETTYRAVMRRPGNYLRLFRRAA